MPYPGITAQLERLTESRVPFSLLSNWIGFWRVLVNYGALQQKFVENPLEMQDKGWIFMPHTKVTIWVGHKVPIHFFFFQVTFPTNCKNLVLTTSYTNTPSRNTNWFGSPQNSWAACIAICQLSANPRGTGHRHPQTASSAARQEEKLQLKKPTIFTKFQVHLLGEGSN